MPYGSMYKGNSGLWHLLDHARELDLDMSEPRRFGTDGEPDPPYEDLCPECFAFLQEEVDYMLELKRVGQELDQETNETRTRG